jgi:hypothetical protein
MYYYSSRYNIEDKTRKHCTKVLREKLNKIWGIDEIIFNRNTVKFYVCKC